MVIHESLEVSQSLVLPSTDVNVRFEHSISTFVVREVKYALMWNPVGFL